jgi:hypothetical protein
MAFSNALAKYIGNELVSAGTKGLAKAGATSALSSLVPKVATGVATNLATKAGTDVATKAGISALDSLFPASEDTIDLYRGQIKGNDNLYYNKGNGTGGSATVGNGFYMTPNEAKTEPWRGEGIEPVHLRASKNDILTRDELVEKTNWANDMLGDLDAMKNLYDNDPQQAELIEALATGHLPEVSKYLDKPFIQPDSGQGEELAETIFFPDTRPMLTNRYKEILRADAEPYVPAGIEKANIVNGRLSDANGNPVRLYHSTPYEFSEFDDSKLGQNTLADNTGYGHFATPDKEFSSRFKDIENRGVDGRTMELQARVQRPITHPYGAGDKYSGEELDNIVRNYFKANGNYESLMELENEASEAGESLYDTYMSYMTSGENPYEVAKWERDDLMKAGYDGMEIVEGPRSQIVEGAKENTPVSSIIAFEGKNFRPTTHLPISSVEGEGLDIPVSGSVLNKVSKYLEAPTDAKLPAGYSNLISKAKNYKSLDRFEKMNNPIKGSEIWGEKPKSYFERDSRAVRINMFPNEAVKGSGITKQYLLNLLKDAYDQGITDIVPSYGSYTKEGASFMNHLAEQGWVKANGKNGWNSYEIAPKIAEWEKTSPLADIYNEAHNVAKGKNFRPTDANADGVINWNDVKSIYAQAKEQQKVLDKLARSISEKEGYPEYQDFAPKSIESMENKVKRKGGDYSLASMKDHTRNKIMMNSWNDVGKTINDIADVFGGTPAVEYVVNDWGYKGLHITGRFDNGLGWEIQLTTPEDWPRKLRSDAIYDKWRNVQLDNASPKEIMGYMNAMRESKAMWSESKIPDLSMFDNTRG